MILNKNSTCRPRAKSSIKRTKSKNNGNRIESSESTVRCTTDKVYNRKSVGKIDEFKTRVSNAHNIHATCSKTIFGNAIALRRLSKNLEKSREDGEDMSCLDSSISHRDSPEVQKSAKT